jgi:plastocyanin
MCLIMPSPFRCLPFLALPLLAGSLQGPVRILDKNGRDRASLQDCVAILEPENPQAARPGPGRPLTIKTVGKQFLPRVSIATPGTDVVFPNLDHILHNVFSVTQGNRFDTGHYLPGEAPRVRVANTGLVKLYCNVHHQMNAFLWVVDTPYAQLLDGRAGLDFGNLPQGSYRLRLWHPETGERTWNLKIGAEPTRGAWDLQVNLPAVEPHLNKFGRNYPPPTEERGY